MLSNENPILKTTPYLDRDNKDVIDTMTHFDDVVSHDSNRQRTPPSQSANTVNQEEVWKPFSQTSVDLPALLPRTTLQGPARGTCK